MGLAEYQRHYYPGTTAPSHPVLYYILFPVSRGDASCLASSRSLSCLALAGRSRQLSPPLPAAKLVAEVASRNNNNII